MEPQRRIPWAEIGITAGVFFLLALFVYGESLSNDFVRWDDGLLIYENPIVRSISPATLWKAFTSYDPELYIPLTFVSYQFDFAIAGVNAGWYHLHNLVLHIMNALLVLSLLRLLGVRRWFAFFGGLFFLLHPLNTEAVIWASARKDLLSTLFLLVSLNAYLLSRRSGEKLWYRLSVAACLLGLLAKVTVIILPALLLLIDFVEHRPWSWKMLKDKVPFIVLGILFLVIGLLGKTGVVGQGSLTGLLFTASKAVLFYPQKFLYPTGLSVIYPYTRAMSLLSWEFLAQVTAIAILLIAVASSVKYTRLVAFAALFYLVAVAPSFLNYSKGFNDTYFASDRYAYIGSIGLLFLLLVAIQRTSAFCQRRWQWCGGGSLIAAIAVCGVLGYAAFAQAAVWKNTESLFRNVIRHYPDSHVAHNNIGNVARRKNDISGAMASYERAVALKRHPLSLSNLASAYRQTNRFDEAIALYREAISLKENSGQAHMGLGVVYAQLGQAQEAEAEYARAIEIDPAFPEAHLNIGALRAKEKRYEEAITHYDSAITFNPYLPQAYYNRGVALRALQRNREALDAYAHAVELAPQFVAARINLGILLAERRKIDEAVAQFEEVLKYDPQNKQALSVLEQLGVE